MALIECGNCGKMFSDRAKQCPECGCTIEQGQQILLERQQQEAEARALAEQQAAEARALAEQEAAERAERRKEWLQQNYMKIIIVLAIIIGVIVAIIGVSKFVSNAKQTEINQIAMKAIASGDSCLNASNFDKAEEYYNLASNYTNEDVVIDLCRLKKEELREARETYRKAQEKSYKSIPTNAELWEQFEAAYLRYYHITSLNQNSYSVARKNIQNFLYAGKQEGADITRILTDYSSDWKWLGDYIQQVNGPEITSEVRWRFSVVAFFLANEGDSKYNVDFTRAGKPEAWRNYYK